MKKLACALGFLLSVCITGVLYAQEKSGWAVGLIQSGNIFDISTYELSFTKYLGENDEIRFHVKPSIQMLLIGGENYDVGGSAYLDYLHILSVNYFSFIFGTGLGGDFSQQYNGLNSRSIIQVKIPVIIGIRKDINEFISIGIESAIELVYQGRSDEITGDMGNILVGIHGVLCSFNFKL